VTGQGIGKHARQWQRSGDGQTIDYQYDDLSRLQQALITAADGNTQTEQYQYDANGNRTGISATLDWQYNETGLLHSRGTGLNNIGYEYDANGNQIRMTDAFGSRYFRYDIKNRLVAVEDDEHQLLASYRYDPFDRRLSKTVAGVTRYFLYANEGLIAEYDQQGAAISRYGYRPGSMWGTEPVFMQTKAAGNPAPAYYYYHNDHLGSPDNTGFAVWEAQFDSFGRLLAAGNNKIDNPLRFPGQYFDAETGLHYNWHRYYDPELGRYISSDPIGLAGGINFYGYSNQNPLMYMDPYGLWVPPSLPSGVVNFGAGLGDVLTFGLTRRAREALDIGGVDLCSSAYKYGEVAGIAGSVMTGFIGGTKAVATASSKLGAEYGVRLVDFSHSLKPSAELKNIGTRFANWLNKKGNRLNGDYVPRNLHWRMDPVYRTKFLNDALRAEHVPFSDFRGLINRMPYTPGGLIYGATSMAANEISIPECGC
jgi:RHS repeat-associated protein